MTGPEVLDVARDAIITIVIVAAPLMLVGLAIGERHQLDVARRLHPRLPDAAASSSASSFATGRLSNRSASRVGAVWLVKRVLQDGWTIEKATEEAKLIGLRSEPLEKFAVGYIETHKK